MHPWDRYRIALQAAIAAHLALWVVWSGCGSAGDAPSHQGLNVENLPRSNAPPCTVAAAQAVAPPGVTVGPIPDLNPQLPRVPSGALLVPAERGAPSYCLVTGSVVTNPDSGKTANFGAALPLRWNHRFLFTGCGGFCGEVFNIPPNDQRGGGSPPDALARGFAIVATDDGHAATPVGNEFDGSWALARPGVPNDEAIIDYYHRAVHAVTVAAKKFVQRWYSGALQRSYFYGCSDGGREGMIEAARHTNDFDGYIIGAPFMDIPSGILGGRTTRALLDAPDAYIPPELLAEVNRAVYARCDAADGVEDELIQNPAACAFRPESMACDATRQTTCLSRNQIGTWLSWITHVSDPQRAVVSFGYSVSDMYDPRADGPSLFLWTGAAGPPRTPSAAQPWGDDVARQPFGWAFYDQFLRYFVFRDPAYDNNRNGPLGRGSVIDEATIARIESATREGRADDIAMLEPFTTSRSKMIMYHGYSDGFLTPFRTVRFFEDWAVMQGGYTSLGRRARLFMVPGMYHCHQGPGPNFLDTLDAIERWVERGQAPEHLTATKYRNDDRTQAVQRTMPVCAFPTQATYLGEGDVRSASSWSCEPSSELIEVGPNGNSAGLASPYRMPRGTTVDASR